MDQARHRLRSWQAWLPVALGVLLLVAAAFYYADRLTAWQAYDDEGGYLYAAWRISLGEMPYRDFLTPQLPAFLYPGSWAMSLFGMSITVARWHTMLLTLGACVWLWLGARRLYGAWQAILVLALVLVEQEIFWAARFFRPEAPMLFWGMLGLYLFIVGRQKQQWPWLAGAGAAMGLAMVSKLFGALFVGGLGLWLLHDGIRGGEYRRMLKDGLIVAAAFACVVGGVALTFSLLSPNFFACVFEHHVRQGAGMSLTQMIKKTLLVFYGFVRSRPAYSALAAIGIGYALWEKDRLRAVFALQIPTAFAFFALTRGLSNRHLTYLVPSLAALAATSLVWVWRALWVRDRTWSKVVAVALTCVLGGVAVYPHGVHNAFVASYAEADTPLWIEYVREHVRPEQVLVSDYPGINFATQRATTRKVAGISRGAAQTGQIQGSDIILEIEQADVPMVLINVAQGAHQFVNLVDYAEFKEYLQTRYYLSERRRYDSRLMEVYSREDLWPGDVARVDLAHMLMLTGVNLEPVVGQGAAREVEVSLRWQAMAKMPVDYYASVRLVDDADHEWGLGSKMMADVDFGTYWDEEGLEQAVQFPTTAWAVHEQTIQHYELPVDPGTPPGVYHVLLRVHPEGQWNGLSVLAEDGATIGYDVILGDIVIPAAEMNANIEAYEMDEPIDAAMLPDLTLLARRAIVDRALPGDTVDLTFLWKWRGEAARHASVRVSLEGKEGVPVELEGTLLSPGWDDVPLLDEGNLSVEAYRLPVPRDVSPGRYDLAVSVRQSGQESEQLLVASIEIPAYERQAVVPADLDVVQAQFGEGLWLQAAKVRSQGGTVMADLAWRCERPTDTRYTVFCHLVGADGGMLAQADLTPGGGMAPTTSWASGQVVHDRVSLALPEGTEAAGVNVLVGMYDPLTGVRLSVHDSAGQPIGDHMSLQVALE